MNNYIGPGNAVTVEMPYAATSGVGVLKGAIFGVAQNTYASGATGVLAREGVYTNLVKASGTGEAWSVGDALYWNDTNKNLVKASGTGNTASPVAIALEAVGTAVIVAGEVVLKP